MESFYKGKPAKDLMNFNISGKSSIFCKCPNWGLRALNISYKRRLGRERPV
jgi:hypothetical protein